MKSYIIRIGVTSLVIVFAMVFGALTPDVEARGWGSNNQETFDDNFRSNRQDQKPHGRDAQMEILDLEQGGKVFTRGNNRATIHTYVAPDNFVTTHIIEGPESLVIIDTQEIELYAAEVRDYIDGLGKTIDRVILSHSHPDHTGGLRLGLYEDAAIYALSDTADALAAGVFGMPSLEIENTIGLGQSRIAGLRFEFLQFDGAEDAAQLVVVLPDLNALIVQDLAYNGAHLFLGNAVPNNDPLENWIDVLQTLLATQDQDLVLVGHGYPGDRRVLAENIKYLKTAIKVRARSVDFGEFQETMIEKFLHYDLEEVFFYGGFGFAVPYPSSE
jgi:glyoxylase-like metal-dependent hydrolase (beta-lactamase superfamily II)